MAKPTYYELLKHPKWQEKRLRILERAGFKCEWCEDQENTLHVHHTYYKRGAKPWEYDDASLLCLCAACHERAEYLKADLAQIAGVLSIIGESEVEALIGYAKALMIANDTADTSPMRGFIPIESHHEAFGVADFLRVSWEDVMKVVMKRESEGGEPGIYISPREDS